MMAEDDKKVTKLLDTPLLTGTNENVKVTYTHQDEQVEQLYISEEHSQSPGSKSLAKESHVNFGTEVNVIIGTLASFSAVLLVTIVVFVVFRTIKNRKKSSWTRVQSSETESRERTCSAESNVTSRLQFPRGPRVEETESREHTCSAESNVTSRLQFPRGSRVEERSIQSSGSKRFCTLPYRNSRDPAPMHPGLTPRFYTLQNKQGDLRDDRLPGTGTMTNRRPLFDGDNEVTDLYPGEFEPSVIFIPRTINGGRRACMVTTPSYNKPERIHSLAPYLDRTCRHASTQTEYGNMDFELIKCGIQNTGEDLCVKAKRKLDYLTPVPEYSELHRVSRGNSHDYEEIAEDTPTKPDHSNYLTPCSE